MSSDFESEKHESMPKTISEKFSLGVSDIVKPFYPFLLASDGFDNDYMFRAALDCLNKYYSVFATAHFDDKRKDRSVLKCLAEFWRPHCSKINSLGNFHFLYHIQRAKLGLSDILKRTDDKNRINTFIQRLFDLIKKEQEAYKEPLAKEMRSTFTFSLHEGSAKVDLSKSTPNSQLTIPYAKYIQDDLYHNQPMNKFQSRMRLVKWLRKHKNNITP